MTVLRQGSFTRNFDNSRVDATSWAEFFLDPVPDEVASAREGRPIFRDEERVRIYFPGNQHTRPVFKVTDEHKQRWPKEYEAFKAGVEISPDGIPIEQWPVLRKSQVLELKALGFRTVEEVRDMNDMIIQKVGMGARQLKTLAASYLDDQVASAHNARLTTENETMRQRTVELEKKVEELSALLEQVHGQLMTLRNAPNPIATQIPGLLDPIEQSKARQPQDIGGPSSLSALQPPRRRGRPPKMNNDDAPELPPAA